VLPDPAGDLTGAGTLALPACVLGAALAARLTRLTRAAMLDVLGEEFVTAARARGLRESTVMVKHVLRSALNPVVTVMGLQLAGLLAGAIVVEKVFSRPGLGTLLLDAISRRDYGVVQGCVIVIAVSYVVVNALVDLLHAALDPRIRLGEAER
jgi:peptide/nickel transport system permease protein